MASINYTERLDETIRKLELQHADERKLLRQQFNEAYESIKPANLIRTAISDIATSPDLKGNLVNYAIGMGTGYLTRKVVMGATHNPLTKLLGGLLQVGVSNVVSKKSDLIKSAGTGLLKMILSKIGHKKRKEDSSEEQKYNEALYMDA